MKDREITLPELLKQQGYTTGHFGKWHLGTLTMSVQDANRGGPRGKEHFSPPSRHGYDTSFVTESKVPTFDPMIKPRGAKAGGNWEAMTDKSDAVAYGTRYWDNDGNEVTDNVEGDDSRIIMDRVIPFIERAAADDKPFFAAVWFHAPHLPCVAGPDHVRHYTDQDVAHRNYYGCVTALDEQLGRLRAKLKQLDAADNTMLWFCSDNGPEGKDAQSPGSAGDLRGRKRSLYEGGVRVPGVLVWPGHTSPGTSTDFPPSRATTCRQCWTHSTFLIRPNDRSMACRWSMQSETLTPGVPKALDFNRGIRSPGTAGSTNSSVPIKAGPGNCMTWPAIHRKRKT
jgi:arylsulfatase A-like enzyme